MKTLTPLYIQIKPELAMKFIAFCKKRDIDFSKTVETAVTDYMQKVDNTKQYDTDYMRVIKNELYYIITRENFDIDFEEGTAVITVNTHDFVVNGITYRLDGTINFRVVSYTDYGDVPPEYELSKEGSFQGEYYVMEDNEIVDGSELITIEIN